MATGVFRRRWRYVKRKIPLFRRVILEFTLESVFTLVNVTMTQSKLVNATMTQPRLSSVAMIQSKLANVTLVS